MPDFPFEFPASLSGPDATLARAVLADDIATALRCGYTLADLIIRVHPHGFTLDAAPHALEA